MNKPAKSTAEFCDSITHASVVLGVPASVIKTAKKLGAPGFRGHRVAPLTLGPWLEENEEKITQHLTETESLKDKKTLEEIRKLKLANDQKEGRLVPRHEFERELADIVSTFQGAFNDMPRLMATELSGCGPVEIEKRLVSFVEGQWVKMLARIDGATP